MAQRSATTSNPTITMTIPQFKVQTSDGKPKLIQTKQDDTVATFRTAIRDQLAIKGQLPKIKFPPGSPTVKDSDKLLDKFPQGVTVHIDTRNERDQVVPDAISKKTSNVATTTRIDGNDSSDRAKQKNLDVAIASPSPQNVNKEITNNKARGQSTQLSVILNSSNSDALRELLKF